MKTLASLLILSLTGAVEHDDRVGARDCLALVVFSEARGESYLGQALVAQVVINRARRDDTGVCDVAMAPGQFHGLRDWPYPRRPAEIDAEAWRIAREVADAVIEGDYVPAPEVCAKATSFSTGAPPAAGLVEVCRVDGHVFFVEGAK